MKTLRARLFILSVLICFSTVATADDRKISGRIVDSNGRPVAGATIATLWRANGSPTKADGSDYDHSQPEEHAQYWGNIGQMQPAQGGGVTSTADGGFSIECHERALALLVMDRQRERGAIAAVPEAGGNLLEIRLQPLTTVRGSLRSSLPGKKLEFAHVYVELPRKRERPLALSSVISCGSLDGSFEFKIPPGQYTLDIYAYTSGPDVVDLRVSPTPQVSVDGSLACIELGILELQKDSYSPQALARALRTAKGKGTWKDYTQHYGDIAPEWHVTDAQGVARDTRVADFRGKWLLIEFWGLGCAPCLTEGIPKLADYYEKHRSLRSQFEIVGVCIDYGGDLSSIAELHKALEPIERELWQGKKIPFPIILDSTYTSWERFGLPGLGTVILVDPEGRMVPGDETTLETILTQ